MTLYIYYKKNVEKELLCTIFSYWRPEQKLTLISCGTNSESIPYFGSLSTVKGKKKKKNTPLYYLFPHPNNMS